MIKAGIIGATGYAGSELVSLLLKHPDVEIVFLGSSSQHGVVFSDIYPRYRGLCDLVLDESDIVKAAEICDVVFLALPHGLASSFVTSEILKKVKVIDLGADFRLKDVSVYESWYKVSHNGRAVMDQAVYGLCEIHRSEIGKTNLVANPGCYTTCSILSLYPLLKEHLVDPSSLIVDALSGVSGAGRSAKVANLFCEVNESVKAYGVASHRHTPEIEQELSLAAGMDVVLTFTPHLVPMNRGILATCYAKLLDGVDEKTVNDAYAKYYGKEPFIRLCPSLSETRNVEGTNFVDISLRIDTRTGRVIVVTAIDNLVKGAAGQAVQNMNIMFGLDEKEGLI